LFAGRRPYLALLFFQGANRLQSARSLWKLYPDAQQGRFEIDLSAPPGRETPSLFVVRGRVTSSTGAPVAGGTVNVYDEQLQSEDLTPLITLVEPNNPNTQTSDGSVVW
jgi:hypothetical protein